jgi:hypothetical protein
VLCWPDVTDITTPRHDGPVPSLRVFGLPAWLSSSPDEIMLGGPRCSPDEWLWGVYGGYTPRLRHLALGLVNGNAPMAQLAASDFLGVCNVSGYYLLAQDQARVYVTGYSRLFTFHALPSIRPGFVYGELVRAACWLRHGEDSIRSS